MKISNTNNFTTAVTEAYNTVKSWVLTTGDGLKTVYAWFKDGLGNWTEESIPVTDTITLDETAPTISNITTSSITTSSATINFNTNENATSYVEYGLTTSYGSQTETSSLLSSFIVLLSNLSDNTTYNFRITSTDEAGNISQSINQTFQTTQSSTPDTTPPAIITNLSSSNITQTSANLTWTSPGDDNTIGTASTYDLRYSTTNITNDTEFNNATQLSGEPNPETAGTIQSLYIAVGLSPNTTYYFAIKTTDEVPNISGISNVISIITLSESTPVPDPDPTPGGGGGGGSYTDTTPPSNPSEFIATPAESQITLTWNNPTDSDFVRVKILRKENEAPISHNDETAIIIYEGTNEEYTDIELDNNKTYHYAIFAYDQKPNYSNLLTISSQPEAGKTTIEIPNGSATLYPDGTLIKIPESFKVYIIINQKKKWIPTPEVFETLGYQWGEITITTKTNLNKIPNYEDNLIRAINDYKVYLVVNGISRHLPNPEIFLDYGFSWEDVVDVSQTTIDQYQRAYLVRESRQGKIYYLREDGIKKHIPNPEVFSSYQNNWEDIQVISQKEMESYVESNLIQLEGDNGIYLIENGTKKYISSAEIFNRNGFNWESVVRVNEVEFGIYGVGEDL